MAMLHMPKSKPKRKRQSKREERDFAQTAFSVFQKANSIKPNVRQSGQRHSRSSHGR